MPYAKWMTSKAVGSSNGLIPAYLPMRNYHRQAPLLYTLSPYPLKAFWLVDLEDQIPEQDTLAIQQLL